MEKSIFGRKAQDTKGQKYRDLTLKPGVDHGDPGVVKSVLSAIVRMPSNVGSRSRDSGLRICPQDRETNNHPLV